MSSRLSIDYGGNAGLPPDGAANPAKIRRVNSVDFGAEETEPAGINEVASANFPSFSLTEGAMRSSFPRSASTSLTSGPSAEHTAQCPTPPSDSEAQSSPSGHNPTQWDGHGLLSNAMAMVELQINDIRRPLRMWYKQNIQPFWKIAIAQIFCVIYILVLTFSRPPVGIKDPTTNDIIDPNSAENTRNGVIYVNGSYRPVVAIGGWQKFFLAISRMSAFSLYPMMVVVFVTKMKALQYFLAKTPVSIYVGMINEGHDYHVHAGRYIAFEVWLHTLFHVLRWISQGNMKLLWTSAAGISGLVTVIATPLITFPMMYCKERIRYEVRKGLHYLFYVFAIAMCFHVPTTAIPNGGFIAPILGSCIVMYTLDATYVFLFMAEKIETTAFYVLSSGVRISMPVSEKFKRRAVQGGYAYICLPWINDKQWHAFSLFEDPSDPSTLQMFLLKNGDWTDSVHKALSRDTTRPCWIKGPFLSPYSHASLYDKLILVATGIGITPALAAINAFKSSRRVNLIWVVRDPEMLEFFLEHMYLDHDGWNLIFYTGKKSLASSIESVNTNVKVIKRRPKLGSIIPNVIYGIESKMGLPEKYTERSKEEMKKLLTKHVFELDADSSITAAEKITKLRIFGDALGFSLDKIMEEINQSCDKDGGVEPFMEPLMELFSKDDPHSLRSEDSADNLMAILKASLNMAKVDTMNYDESVVPMADTRNPNRMQSLESVDEFPRSLSGIIDSDIRELPASRMWTTMRNTVDEKDSNSLLTPAFCPWMENKRQESYVRGLDDYGMSTWGMMYCGGSKPVIASLREISIDFNIDLHIDSFAW